MQQKVWVYKEINELEVGKLAAEAGISRLLAKVFISRGIFDAGFVRDFLEPDIKRFHDPFLMDGMDKAVGRILQAVENGEKILVYGDYDVDGVTSTSILYRFLDSRGASVQYYIPDRMEDGYGLTLSTAEKVKMLDASLMITVDCGITSVEEIKILQASGWQVIVTDHHECKEILPEAFAILNPHKPGCRYPFKGLAGAGVALKLVQGLCLHSGCAEDFLNYLDLAALATIADIVPLIDENRIIASLGLKRMEFSKNQGLMALIHVAGLSGKPITSFTTAFGLAPRVNAAGRLGSAIRGVRLFTTEDRVLAEALAKELDMENRNRQETENQILEEACRYVEERLDPVRQKVLVICGAGWHHGVIGIVASKILERYYRPCIVISIEQGVGKGSGRSIKSFNLFNALSSCEHLLDRFGGHEMAAGLTIQAERIEELSACINAYADSVMTETDLLPYLRVDAFLNQSDISLDSVRQLSKMAPYGEGNHNPHFGYLAFSVGEIRKLSGDKHLKLKLMDGDLCVEAIGFGMGAAGDSYAAGDAIDAVFTPDVNVWNGTERLQLNIRDIRPCVYEDLDKNIVFNQSNDYNRTINLQKFKQLLKYYNLNLLELVPDRLELESVFRYLKSNGKQMNPYEIADLFACSVKISEKYKVRMNFFKLKRSLEIFDELGLLSIQSVNGRSAAVQLAESTGKVELQSSKLLLELQNLYGRPEE